MILRLLALTALALGGACAPASVATRGRVSADSAAIRAAFDKVIRDVLQSEDPDSAAASYVAAHTADAVLMFAGQPPVVGSDSIRAFARRFFSAYAFQFSDWHTDELVVMGDWAFHRFTGTAIATPRSGGQQFRELRKYLDVWRRDSGGRWRIGRHIYNANQ